MAVRALEPRDVGAVLAIQAACPEIAQWSRLDYERVEAGEMAGWVAERIMGAESPVPAVVGFVVARNIPHEVEILNIAVLPSARKHGVGSDLFDRAIEWARSERATQIILEVRAGNDAALRLYHRRNFQIVGRRPRYYSNPVDDALLLTASI
jgi:[ribosomal protein S18]-alanine N-acetyltransferase